MRMVKTIILSSNKIKRATARSIKQNRRSSGRAFVDSAPILDKAWAKAVWVG
jgi:hypothetical protein